MIEPLKTFIAVVEERHFTRAAERLHLSQPSVSLHIKQVERYFAATLIQRSVKQKTIHITEAGQFVYERAKQMIQLLDETMAHLHETELRGKLVIGASLTIGEYILPALLGRWLQQYPDVQLEVVIDNTTAIGELVRTFQVDIGLVEGTLTSPQLTLIPFYEDTLYVVNRERDVALHEVTWISRESGSGTHEYFQQFLADYHITPRHLLTFNSNFAVKEAVKHGLGAAFLSSLVTAPDELPIVATKRYTRPFCYVVPMSSTTTKKLATFIDFLRQSFQEDVK